MNWILSGSEGRGTQNMREFKTASLADQVFAKLESDIIQGVYPKGEILTELKLVEQLGVSRTPIREALRRLEQERLIAESGKGSVVLGITEEDLVDIMDIRLRVEGLASYYATKNITEEGLKELSHVVDLSGRNWGKVNDGWICLEYTDYDSVVNPGTQEGNAAPPSSFPTWEKLSET